MSTISTRARLCSTNLPENLTTLFYKGLLNRRGLVVAIVCVLLYLAIMTPYSKRRLVFSGIPEPAPVQLVPSFLQTASTTRSSFLQTGKTASPSFPKTARTTSPSLPKPARTAKTSFPKPARTAKTSFPKTARTAKTSFRKPARTTSPWFLKPARTASSSFINPANTTNPSFLKPATSSAKKETAVRSKAKIILIIAYMRSGSTLTGSILQEFPESFYVYEPLRKIYDRALHGGETLTDLHGRPRNVSRSSLREEVENGLQHWLQCKLDLLDIHTLTDSSLKYFSTKMRKFSECQSRVPARGDEGTRQAVNGSKFVESELEALVRCVPLAKKLCETSAVRVFKFIRLEMRTVLELMPFYPNMQVIHLLRDPRAILDSQKRSHLLNEDLEKRANSYCQKMYIDLSYTHSLLKQYPRRMKLLLYEDLASSPITVTDDLYRFAKLPITEAIHQYVQKMTSSGLPDGCQFCTERGNSSITANKWRTHVTKDQVRSINSKCTGVYRILGYRVLKNFADVKKLSKPTRFKIDVINRIKNFKFNQSQVHEFEVRFNKMSFS